MQRQIVFLRLDNFFVAVEKLRNAALAGKPVIVGNAANRGVVVSCNEEAQQAGVYAGMGMKQAMQLCPQAVLKGGDMDVYAQYSRMVTDRIVAQAAVVEKISIDKHIIDVTGEGGFADALKWAKALQQSLAAEMGLQVSFGLGANRTVAEIACDMAGAGAEYCVLPGTEKAVMALLPVKKIPGIDAKMVQLLRNMGIDRMQGLQQMTAATAGKLLGAQGMAVWNKANGIDDMPVAAIRAQRTAVATETRLENAITDKNQLRKTLITMIHKLVAELRREQRLASCVALEVYNAHTGRQAVQVKLPYSADEAVLAEKALRLFDKIYKGQVLQHIGVQLSGLTSGAYQIDLFSDTITEMNLHQAQDRVRGKYVHSAVRA